MTGVKAGSAAAAASVNHVTSIAVADSADNIVANLDDLQAIDSLGLLQGLALAGKNSTLTMDASRLQGDQLAATQGVLSKITGASYSLAVTGVSMTSLNDLAGNARIVSMEVGGSGAQIASNLDRLYQLGKKVTAIQQSDSGVALDLTQASFESRASVLAKIDGGYTVNVTGVTAGKALADAMNGHVAQIAVADTGKNLAANWNALRAIGATLNGVAKTDNGSLSLTVGQYQSGLNEQLLGKFDASLKFSVFGASVLQAAQIGSDDAVDKIDVTDDGDAVTARLAALEALRAGGKLHSISLNTPAASLALHASQLDGAEGVLGLISGGRYTLAIDQVDAADAKTLLTANAKIASMKVTGDAAGIVANLADLATVGHKLTGIAQTDAATAALALTAALYEQNKGTLAKIAGGYLADLSGVAAAKAATFAASTHVKSLQVADSGANLAAAWDTLGTLGTKLTDIAQSDSSAVQLTLRQWASAPGLGGKFSTSLAVSVSGASIADLAALSGDDAVQQIQLSDTAEAISDALGDLAAESKLTQIQISDPSNALAMSADTYGASSALLALVKDGQYSVALSGVAVTDVATLGADAHVSAMDATGSSDDIAANFGALSAQSKLTSLTLSDEDGTLALSSAQILGNAGAGTLAKITNAFQIAATGVAMADLADILSVAQVASIAISDTAENVSANFGDLLALGGSLSGLHLSDATPVLALAQQDWAAGAAALARIDGSYQVDLSEVSADDASTLAADPTVRQLSVADTSGDIASRWSALIGLFNNGAGKLAALTLTDADPLMLTADQQTAGAAMITALLPDATIVPAV